MNAKVMAVAALSALLAASGARAGGGGAPGTPDFSTLLASVQPNFSTLSSALKAAGLSNLLASSGAFTVFAPTNAAFAKVPAAQLKALLNDPAALRKVLLYHVVPGRVTSAQIAKLSTAKTVEGSTLNIAVSGGTVRVNDATVIQADIPAANGVVHVIDTVLLPPQ